ncbi:heptaprenyl diphosphate synthase component 1 [Alicyclobacillus tolerans]|uniref:heptaprenyl diphosphate synthase component 1 n=1 Tax=Alicyclobacillus tolerans TaxID=90970 RepID=UPI001F40ADF3|nr:heptaprenyl diphosphate synthase component 1 [Alicyclobacillus tolerans]MCF8563733.1 heptaprenyl diphosphate synthase component 1 [Alicyclobacillus tolerans]
MTETNRLRFHEVDERVQQYIRHPYLAACQVRQSVSRFHFDVALTILQAASVPVKQMRAIVEAVLLLQHGLSIHDEVDGQAPLLRQLNVLAGDYSSGHYYRVMAKTGNLKLMSTLCTAVVRVNEAKMTLFHLKDTVTPERYMTLRETIHGELLFALARTFLHEPDGWMEHLRSLVRAYTVNEDILNRRAPNYFTLRQAYEWVSDAIERVLMQTNTVFEPVVAFVTESFVPMRKSLEQQSFVEGNR